MPKNKETTLSIHFIDGKTNDENMSRLMGMLGVKNSCLVVVPGGWNISSPSGMKMYTTNKEFMEFVSKSMFNAVITEAEREEYHFGTYENKTFIESKYFCQSETFDPYTSLGSVWAGHIGIKTRGDDATKAALDRLHKKNVLSLKDKIVSMEHVQHVEYTCTLRNIDETECSV